MKRLILVAAILLAVLHQDTWWWDSTAVVLGFLPVGLAYHVGFSLASALLWLVAVKFAWPSRWESWAEGPDGQDDGS